MTKGGFTLPGESGYEELTLKLAERWGADVIRDSDGTNLSEKILKSGYSIYSTICPVREHNGWIKSHKNMRQQTFLCTSPRSSQRDTLEIQLLDDFYNEQFEVNDTLAALTYWQVYDRTAGLELPRDQWEYDSNTGTVKIQTIPHRQYTVSFLAWRIWEEISMYNHITNKWDKEHLGQLNPYHPEALEYLKKWLADWCKENPNTDVVRFTSLFYNFAWIWGCDERNRYLFTDWGSYDFTVCPKALHDFEEEYGYALCAEDFTRGGRYYCAHRVPDKKKLDWMEFIGRFVRKAGRELTDVVHAAGKLAYVFYDDNWVGTEPYSGHFEEFGFDGLVKCVFSGFEARLCAGVPVNTHEIRFHPYLFPIGLGGAPTFSTGGEPGKDAMAYWINVRRALLREKIQRCGLGGYLSLTSEYPCFLEAMDEIVRQFREILELHESGKPLALKPRVAILHAWGKLRTWTVSGHFHETSEHLLTHVLESLSGLPFDVTFLSFDDISKGVPSDIDVIINAGMAGDAWSGGSLWGDIQTIENLTKWVHDGGAFIGIGEPSAFEGSHRFLRMAHVLGVDIDNGDYSCHGRWDFEVKEHADLIPDGLEILHNPKAMLTGAAARVLAERDGIPVLTSHDFGKGRGLYCAGFHYSPSSPRFLQNLILLAAKEPLLPECVTDDAFVEASYYPSSGKLALASNSELLRTASCTIDGVKHTVSLDPLELRILDIE